MISAEAGGIPGTYVILDSKRELLFRTTAHEIGHCLNLRHPFDALVEHRGFLEKVPDNSTERLMGYGSGTRLIRAEWDIINVP